MKMKKNVSERSYIICYMGWAIFQNFTKQFWPVLGFYLIFMHYHHKLLKITYVGLCKVLCPKEGLYEIEKRYKNITARDWAIVDVVNLKIKSYYHALVSIVKKGFFDSSGEEERKKMFMRMDEERDTKKKIKRKQEI